MIDLRTFLAQSADLSDEVCLDAFAQNWTKKPVRRGGALVFQGASATDEFIALEGRLASTICDPEGKEVCVGFFVAPCVVTPSIARTRDGVSRVSVVATTDVSCARIDAGLLTRLMISSQAVRNWANGVLRDALSEKADREWCLAALGGAERLAWFRETYPGCEDMFTHSLIASFLGVTPVTLSRLRASNRPG
ncbi:MAG: Crp/Fnr family transcriptional regulator [Boseongicola sp.]|nr:Crp/Fnr family transcriptional regulator [Boseongicola sp.]NNJ68449.1 Crp/Fnr family transcriptional regulator [Boseongicola sp.]